MNKLLTMTLLLGLASSSAWSMSGKPINPTPSVGENAPLQITPSSAPAMPTTDMVASPPVPAPAGQAYMNELKEFTRPHNPRYDVRAEPAKPRRDQRSTPTAMQAGYNPAPNDISTPNFTCSRGDEGYVPGQGETTCPAGYQKQVAGVQMTDEYCRNIGGTWQNGTCATAPSDRSPASVGAN